MISFQIQDLINFCYQYGELSSDKTFVINKKVNDLIIESYKKSNDFSLNLDLNHSFIYQDNIINIKLNIDKVIKDNFDNSLITLLRVNNNDDFKSFKNDNFILDELLNSYIYMLKENLESVNTELIIISSESKEISTFNNILIKEEIEEYFYIYLKNYLDFFLTVEDASSNVIETIKDIKFPYPKKRLYQTELMKVLFTYFSKELEYLYIEAPTGIGKTLASLFSSLKTIKSKNEKILYLTAKSTGTKVVKDTIKLLNENDLKIHSTFISAKYKVCLTKAPYCNVKKCLYGRNFFVKGPYVIKEMLENHLTFDEEIINEYSVKHKVCPFELSLFLSEVSNLVVLDYNYCFDPRVKLVRYFEENNYTLKVLVDEAHNLSQRAKDMYSTTLKLSEVLFFTEMKHVLNKEISPLVENLLRSMISYKNIVSNEEKLKFSDLDFDLVKDVRNLVDCLEEYLSEKDDLENYRDLLERFYSLRDFVDLGELFSDNYSYYVSRDLEEICFNIMCIDPNVEITNIIDKSIKNICFFSATLTPIEYHMNLLTGGSGKFLKLPNPFDEDNLNLIINDKISTFYKDRERTISEIVKNIEVLVNSKIGNYIVFVPSYKYLELLVENLNLDIEIILQSRSTTNKEKEEVINKFKDNTKTKLAIFVLGGVYSEGIDFIGELLSGVIIVGVGLPQINFENDLIKNHFQVLGFDYAYTYPGIIKVIQAMGRVIRSEKDRGVVILIDKRYNYPMYIDLLDQFYSKRKTINDIKDLELDLINFWSKEK